MHSRLRFLIFTRSFRSYDSVCNSDSESVTSYNQPCRVFGTESQYICPFRNCLGLCIKNSPWDFMHMPKMVMNATNILEKKGIFGRDTLHRFLGPFCLLRVMLKFLKWKNVFKNAPPHPHSVILLHLITMTVDNFLSPQQGSSTSRILGGVYFIDSCWKFLSCKAGWKYRYFIPGPALFV